MGGGRRNDGGSDGGAGGTMADADEGTGGTMADTDGGTGGTMAVPTEMPSEVLLAKVLQFHDNSENDLC